MLRFCDARDKCRKLSLPAKSNTLKTSLFRQLGINKAKFEILMRKWRGTGEHFWKWRKREKMTGEEICMYAFKEGLKTYFNKIL